jgi:RNA polymerase sigma factor (sigma-70 family)
MGVIWSTVRRYRLNDSDSYDVTQTTWLRLVQNIERIEDPTRLGGWLATTASRESLRILAQRQRVVPTDDSTVFDRSDPHSDNADAGLIGEERDTAINELFEQLTPGCRELLALLMADPPMNYQEIAGKLEMPVGSIGPTRGRCLKKLNALAAERGIDLTALRS